MKGNPVNIEEWARYLKFETCGEPQLEQMVRAAAQFIAAIKSHSEPRWLTLAGSSGAGKTYLAKKIYRWVVDTQFFQTKIVGNEIAYPVDFLYWPKVALSMQQQQESEEVYHAPRTQFLVLDELGGIRDASGYVTNRLSVILGQRTKKWTIITTNLTVEQVSERVDTRIASRLIRDNNEVVELDVIDYALRKIQ